MGRLYGPSLAKFSLPTATSRDTEVNHFWGEKQEEHYLVTLKNF